MGGGWGIFGHLDTTGVVSKNAGVDENKYNINLSFSGDPSDLSDTTND